MSCFSLNTFHFLIFLDVFFSTCQTIPLWFSTKAGPWEIYMVKVQPLQTFLQDAASNEAEKVTVKIWR